MSFDRHLSRRSFLSYSALTAASALTGCASSANTVTSGDTTIIYRSPMRLFQSMGTSSVPSGAELAVMYGPIEDGGFLIPAVPYEQIDPRYYRQQVDNTFGERPGTIIVDTGEKYLYFVEGGGKAVRYGIGVGREGFEWKGTARVGAKREWPVWTPPPAMIKRQPELAKWRGGMPGGPQNALGARALYLHNKGGDSGYRLHGTPEWWSIGKAMSSGCIRMMNQDVIDLYSRANVGAKVIVK